MWKPTNLMEALLPIFIFDWIFCHGVMPYNNVKKLKIKHSLLYSVITFILYVLFLIIVASKYVTLEGTNNVFDVTIRIMRLMNIIIMIINIVVGWIFRNRAVKLNMDVLKTDETLKSLGISINVQREFYFALKVAVFWIFLIIFNFALQTQYDFKNLEELTLVVLSTIVYHGYHVNWLIDLRFFLVIKHMRLRFRNINKVLEKFLITHTKNVTQEETNDRCAIPIERNFDRDFLYNIRCIHFQLGTLCRNTTTIYGTQIAFTTIGSLVAITNSMYRQYLYLLNPSYGIYVKILSVAGTAIILMPSFFNLFNINYICQKTVNEWKQTGVILDKLELEAKDTESQSEIRNFSTQIQRNFLKFSPCGFFDLGIYFVRDFAAAVVTYLIIIVQTYPSDD